MSSIASLISSLLIGTVIVVGIGVYIQLKQQNTAKKKQLHSDDDNRLCD